MESEKNSKSAKEEKPQVSLSASLPLSGTSEHPLASLRGESAAEGKNSPHALTAERLFTAERWVFPLCSKHALFNSFDLMIIGFIDMDTYVTLAEGLTWIWRIVLQDQEERVVFNVFKEEQQMQKEEDSHKATCQDVSMTSFKAANSGFKGKNCFLSQVREEEKVGKGRTVHDDLMQAQLKFGKLVRFKNKLWVVKEYKDNGVIEIESPYSRRVKKVDRKQLMSWCDDRMTSSSSKRYKTIGSKRKDKEPECTHSRKFLSRKHEKHFKIVQDRRLLTKRKAGLIPELAPQFGEQMVSRNWRRLATYPAPANIAVVKEFYTNARRLGDHPVEDYLSYVRGYAIRNGAVVNIRRIDLTPIAKYWMAFSHANIEPCSHVSDITVSRALLLYCVLKRKSVNIGQVIANEIQLCANTMNTKALLGHPSLITHLCELAGVNISIPPFERPRKASDEAYYRQYCGGDEASQPVPPRHPRRGRGPPRRQASAKIHEAEPFQMRDMYMSLIDAQMQSIHKEQVATVEMMIGMYHTPPAHRWTMDEFHNVVAWPEEQVQGSTAGAAEASAG
ncbi:hypothetical protein LR48_Vigan660s000100 [Vigna angularis]|uniref:Putative plant transposon protein domain-containing protein n=1 Tax=Phaseolus angularis TaxID=3914 RepID=A0A0L9TFV8_PHAAN|nr:hypothetical protein LR48_Vigan660s000100 [Vigna angularis]